MKSKWIKIESGYHGKNQKWQYGERIFMSSTSYKIGAWYFYELPKINSEEHIYNCQGHFLSVLAKFKRFIELQSSN